MDETTNLSETAATRSPAAAPNGPADETKSLAGTEGSQPPVEGSSGSPDGDPSKIGRYRIIRRLGQGGFGRVYLAHDDDLDRRVAIKVPNPERTTHPEDVEAFLVEARILARLDHPHIVPVFDVGRTEDGLCFVVSKLVEGSDLAARMGQAQPTFRDAAELVATIADALHYAHTRGLVHRDVKPANILIDASGRPCVADFGLALKDEDFGKGAGLAGTPAYMSPEQARGEGHRVDGRSDIFSLGVVFYELLTGKKPFRGDSVLDVLESIKTTEPRPPRQIDDMIPKELERICLKALSKRALERYSTARDMAEDLGLFIQTAGAVGSPDASMIAVSIPPGSTLETAPPPSTSRRSDSDRGSIPIVPRGLRSFDEHDADFFLELIPGPRDRDGLPDSIRFWKRKIEQVDPDLTFKVGLIYGPSGCGKSSMVKAGLLPRLGKHVLPVYIEATPDETEARLLRGLRKVCPELPRELGLVDSLASLRRGRVLPADRKVLLVLDQFEQWLHAEKEEENTDLVQGLRQCDGGRVQCIVMVRDDFWMAATRFMRELEIRLLEGQNSAAVDLFDMDHARTVLAAFGRAFGKLPEDASETGKEQKEFLKQAVSGLAQEGKVISVRLALFAEMMKGKSWTPASLRAVGGTEGVGITFLEETFSAATAPPQHRYHEKAARADLKVLLPETGSDIKGHMRSYAELLEASGYRSRPEDFDDLIRILDDELRLITPTEPEGREADGDSVLQTKPGQKYYQLTHDYLVHSIREWLTRKQKETRRGRAELLLADRAAVWNARPENRQLPSLLQWTQIQWFTARKNWTPPQRKMMGKAGRYHAMRGAAVAVLLAVATVTGLTIRDRVEEQHRANREQAEEQRKATYAAGLVQSLLSADTVQVPAIIAEMSEYRQWTDPVLHEERDKAGASSRQKLHANLALLPVDSTRVNDLYDRLLDAQPHEVPVIRDALALHKDGLLDKLWAVVAAPDKGKESQRLRAAAALAKYDAASEKWATAQEAVVNDLVAVPALHLSLWMESLRPVRTMLLPQLSVVYRDSVRRETERSLATDILADYAADNPQVLADLLMDADEEQFAAIYPKLKDRSEQGLPLLTGEINKKLPSDLPSSDETREKLAKRRANAAVALLRLGQPETVWPLLKHSPDPRLRSYLIHRLSPMGADAEALLERLHEEPDITIRRALLLGLGEFNEKELPPASRTSLLPKLQTIYRTDADPGLHAAAEWLLRTWKQDAWLNQVNEEWAKDKEQRAKRLEGIQQQLKANRAASAAGVPPQWYVNGQGQTMVVIPGPVKFVMGSPTTEAGRVPNENQHRRRIGRTFALAAKSVTLAEYRRFDPGYGGDIKQWSPTGDCPVLGTSWFQAAAYCNWLSKQEGLPESEWCYEPLRDAKALPATDPEYKVGMKLAADYLKRSGYRLPSEAEMEFATRAGSVTSRYYGETEELLPKYAWYNKNGRDRSWPAGSKKPNDFGFFDVHGNVFTWCQERIRAYPESKENETHEDKEDILSIGLDNRLLRGGSFDVPAFIVRSAFRQGVVPTYRSDGDVGLRPARTLPIGPSTAPPAPPKGS